MYIQINIQINNFCKFNHSLFFGDLLFFGGFGVLSSNFERPQYIRLPIIEKNIAEQINLTVIEILEKENPKNFIQKLESCDP